MLITNSSETDRWDAQRGVGFGIVDKRADGNLVGRSSAWVEGANWEEETRGGGYADMSVVWMRSIWIRDEEKRGREQHFLACGLERGERQPAKNWVEDLVAEAMGERERHRVGTHGNGESSRTE